MIFSQIDMHNVSRIVQKTIFILVSKRSLNARLVLLFEVLKTHQKSAGEM